MRQVAVMTHPLPVSWISNTQWHCIRYHLIELHLQPLAASGRTCRKQWALRDYIYEASPSSVFTSKSQDED
jgi:hypothetical protein